MNQEGIVMARHTTDRTMRRRGRRLAATAVALCISGAAGGALLTGATPAAAQRPDFCYKVISVDGQRYYESIPC